MIRLSCSVHHFLVKLRHHHLLRVDTTRSQSWQTRFAFILHPINNVIVIKSSYPLPCSFLSFDPARELAFLFFNYSAHDDTWQDTNFSAMLFAGSSTSSNRSYDAKVYRLMFFKLVMHLTLFYMTCQCHQNKDFALKLLWITRQVCENHALRY